MISPSPNSLALRRCLPGRAYSSCAHTPSDAAVVPIRLANCPSPSLLSRLPAPLRPPIRPLGRIDHPTILYPELQTTTLETEQNPLKIGVRARV
jgi:hypothetical protein